MNTGILSDFEVYVKISGRALLSAMWVHDLAAAADKMISLSCAGTDNEAWKEAPYLGSYAGDEDIDRSRSYLLRMSKEFSVASWLVLGPNPQPSKNGGYKLDTFDQPDEFGKAGHTIAKLIIIEQFEIWKDFWKKYNGPYNDKKSKDWRGKGLDDSLDRIHELTLRRNELVHQDACQPPSIREAVEFYYKLRIASEKLAGAPETAKFTMESLLRRQVYRPNGLFD